MAGSFNLESYGARVDAIVGCGLSIAAPNQKITRAVMRRLLVPHVDALSEDLPSLRSLPSPEQVERAAPKFGGIMLRLGHTPTLGDIAEYTQAAADKAAEISLMAFPNGLTTFAIGTTDRAPLLRVFEALELLAFASLHTHSSDRASGTEDLHVSLQAARVPSAADIDHAANVGPFAQYIADRYGATHYTSPSRDIPASYMLELYAPTLLRHPEAEIESIYYPIFANRFSDIRLCSWDDVDSSATLHDLAPYSSFRTGDDTALFDVFAKSDVAGYLPRRQDF